MGKIKTEDCVKALKEKFGPNCSWKRIYKAKDGSGIARLFQEKNTDVIARVYEEGGEIKSVYLADCPPEKTDVVVKNENPVYYVIHKSEGCIGLSVTDSQHFDSEGCQSDWTPDETFEELDRLGYPGSEMMEGMIEFHNDVTDIKTLKDALDSSPVFKFNPAFQKFLKDYENEEFKIIPI